MRDAVLTLLCVTLVGVAFWTLLPDAKQEPAPDGCVWRPRLAVNQCVRDGTVYTLQRGRLVYTGPPTAIPAVPSSR